MDKPWVDDYPVCYCPLHSKEESFPFTLYRAHPVTDAFAYDFEHVRYQRVLVSPELL